MSVLTKGVCVIGAIVAAAAVTGFAPPVTAPVAYSSEPTTDRDTVQNEIRLRERYGFDANASHVSLVDRTAKPSLILGIPLDAAEEAELRRRAALSPAVEQINRILDASGHSGGAWLDNTDGGRIVAAYVGQIPADVRAEVAAAVGSLGSIRFTTVDRSVDDLKELQLRVTASDLPGTLEVQGVGVDIVGSRVTVELAPNAPRNAEDVFRREFGETVEVVRAAEESRSGDALSRDFSSGPLYGGQWLIGNNGSLCTTGYSNVRDSVGRYYTLTAGHCYVNGTVVSQGAATSNRDVGNASSSTARAGVVTNCDCEVVGLIPSGTGTEQTRVNGNNLFRFTNVGNAQIGDTVCQAGAASFEHNQIQSCGDVVLINQTRYLNAPGGGTFQINDQVRAQYNRRGGDSGAPVGRGGALLGFHSSGNGSSGDSGYFSQSKYVGQANVSLGF